MKQPPISFPESLAFYYRDRANRSALNLIMDSPELPPDLGWDEVLAYHDAKLAAQKVRTDYCAFLHNAWERTWGAVTGQLLPESPPSTVAELGKWAPTLDTVWKNTALHGRALLPRRHTLWAAVEFPGERAVSLAFWADDGNDDYTLSDTLPLGALWQPVDDDNVRRTVPGLCTVGENTVDLTPLAEAAHEAVELLVRALDRPESLL